MFRLLLYLKYGNLAPSDGEGHCHTLAVDTEAVTLARCGQVEATNVGDVRVPVHDCPLDMTELGSWP